MLALAVVAALHAGVGVANGRTGAFAFQDVALRQRAAQSDTLQARAESLLNAGQLAAARRIAERLVDRNPRDVRAMVTLGRIFIAWPVYGRLQAESLLSRAAELAPGNPEPLYYLGQAGLTLGGADGEMIARRGLVPLLALEPDYRDAWALWQRLYRGDGERRDAVAALARHAGSWNADYWRAQLLLELRDYAGAATLFADVSGRRPDDPGPRAWLARALYLAGRDAEAAASYAAALERVADDTGQVLWRQVRGAASPAERASWAATPPDARAAFLRLFWVRREPDLSTPANERIAQHFQRLAEAQRQYALLQPNARYFRSPLYRALAGGVGGYPGGLEGAERRALEVQCSARLPGVRDAMVQAGLGPRAEDPARTPPNLEDGLDDRGRIWLRHGRPDYLFVGSLADETWCYYRPDGSILRVTFVRRTGGWGVSGDMVVTPLVSGEAESAAQLLATDDDGRRETLGFTFWPAAFASADGRLTELLLIPDSLHAVAALVDGDGREVARDTGSGRVLHLPGEPGDYLLLVDGSRGRDTSRYRGAIGLPDFGGEAPAVSSVLLAPGATEPSRAAMADAASRGLSLPAAAPLRVYAELYHMGRVNGLSRFRVEYQFERLDGFVLRRGRERTLTVAFDRERDFAPRIIESLLVDPDRLPRGRYRLHIEVTDQVQQVRSTSATIEFRLR